MIKDFCFCPFRIEYPGRFVSWDIPRHIPAGILLNILAGQSTNSRLNLLLREKHGWVYGVESSAVTISDVGWWQIYFGSDPGNAIRALEVTEAELERLSTRPLSPSQLNAWKKQLKGQIAMGSENSESVFLSFGRQLLHTGVYEGVTKTSEKIDAVTGESLLEVARELFDPKQYALLTYTGKS